MSVLSSNDSKETFYLQHRGLIINIVSLMLFFLIQRAGGLGDPDNLKKEPWLAALFIVIFFLEPWATYYSMGALNKRREDQGIKPIWLHRSLSGLFMAGLFWGGRLSIIAVLFMASLISLVGQNVMEYAVVSVVIMVSVLVREAFIIYYLASKKPITNFKEQYDLLADIILLMVLVFGEIIVNELFKDIGLKDLNNWDDGPIVLFPLVLFFFVFYLPIRCIYTIEDFTFAQTNWQKIERVGSFVLVFVSFLFFR